MTQAIRVHTEIVANDEPAPPARGGRTLGALRGLFAVPEDFDAPLPEEVVRAFEGEGRPEPGALACSCDHRGRRQRRPHGVR